MSAVRSQEQMDADLEREIDATYSRMIAAPTENESRELFKEMAILLRRRSPQQIHKMELERRLLMRQAAK